MPVKIIVELYSTIEKHYVLGDTISHLMQSLIENIL